MKTLPDKSDSTASTSALSFDDGTFRAYVEESLQGIIVFDAQWRPLFVNAAYVEILGYDSADEILALSSIEALIHPSDRYRLLSYREARANGLVAPSRYDFDVVRRDGSRLTVEAITTRIRWRGQSAIQTTVSDVTGERRVEREDRELRSRLAAQQRALLALAARRAEDASDEAEMFRTATELVARTLGASRAGVWRCEGGCEFIRAIEVYVVAENRHERGESFARRDFPNYFTALSTKRIIVAPDASTHPDTREFADNYLAEHRVQGLLDAPIRAGGYTSGVLSVEHVGSVREWTDDEQNFVASVADWVSLTIEVFERRRSEQRLRESESRYRTLFEASPVALLEEDYSGVRLIVADWKRRGVDDYARFLSEHPEEVQRAAAAVRVLDVNEATEELFEAKDRGELTAWILNRLATDPPEGYSEIFIQLAEGQTRATRRGRLQRMNGGWMDVRIRLEIDPARLDDWSRVFVALEDVTEHEALSRKLSWQATHDPLTGLVNRREFERRLSHVLEVTRSDDSHHALCYLDLDQFKVINDTCGHVAGDQLLRELATRLRDALRRHDTIARLGGDEFAILMENCELEQAERIAGTLREVVESRRFVWEERSFTLGASQGLVELTSSSGDVHRVLADADAACYAAKDGGRNRIHVHHADDEQTRRRMGEMEWIARIDAALERDAFELDCQTIAPIGRAEDGRLHYELLVRMRVEGKVVPPGAFLPAAERFGVSHRIDRWVVGAAFEFLGANPRHVERLALCSINLSGQSLGNPDFLDFVTSELHRRRLPGNRVCFEITESAAIADLASARHFIASLMRFGCRFALDDFGRGLSSFAYLKSLPVDFLKIDGLFVRDIAEDEVDFAMVRSINEVGHVMGMETVAEFVEDDLILAKLESIGVNYAQGYGIGKPQPLANLGDRADSA